MRKGPFTWDLSAGSSAGEEQGGGGSGCSESVSEWPVAEACLWGGCVTAGTKYSPSGLFRWPCLVLQAAETFDGEHSGNQAMSPAVPWATFPAGTTTSWSLDSFFSFI